MRIVYARNTHSVGKQVLITHKIRMDYAMEGGCHENKGGHIRAGGG